MHFCRANVSEISVWCMVFSVSGTLPKPLTVAKGEASQTLNTKH